MRIYSSYGRVENREKDSDIEQHIKYMQCASRREGKGVSRAVYVCVKILFSSREC
jgi:hypothetical protein